MSDLPAHIFRVALEAYDGLVDGPQAILVSGESGAGKTETTKLALSSLVRLAASAAMSSAAAAAAGIIAGRVLEAGLLLEAFGNARTVRNSNSSRFGKWQTLHFSASGRVAGCSIAHFLLETSRVSSHPAGERNYHIFYQLLGGASAKQRAAWRLKPQAEAHAYARWTPAEPPLKQQRGAMAKEATPQAEAYVGGKDDAAGWVETCSRLTALGFSDAQREAAFTVLAAVLALGDVSFKEGGRGRGGSDAAAPAEPAAADGAASLLGVRSSALVLALTTRRVVAGGEAVTVHLDTAAAAAARDDLARRVYSALWSHVLGRVNEALGGGGGEARTIGLLDVFGFESFERNGFEQLCINYANEVLQGWFMDALIKREQAEYAREGVVCDHIEYPSNAEQVSMLGGKGGIFALLDEECRIPRGSDEALVEKMHAVFEKSRPGLYSRARFGAGAAGAALAAEVGPETLFCVRHYAEEVQYTARGWLDKNRSAVRHEATPLLALRLPATSVEASWSLPVGDGAARRLRLPAPLPPLRRRPRGAAPFHRPVFTRALRLWRLPRVAPLARRSAARDAAALCPLHQAKLHQDAPLPRRRLRPAAAALPRRGRRPRDRARGLPGQAAVCLLPRPLPLRRLRPARSARRAAAGGEALAENRRELIGPPREAHAPDCP